ncbi:hypothetical protein OAV62_01630 [bacterium]|nr:hypothetical protein [bacterium]
MISPQCYKKKKRECIASPDCNWVVGKGCKNNSPVRSSPKCSKKKKRDCIASPDCHWIVGKGCKRNSPTVRSPSVSRRRSLSPAPRQSPPIRITTTKKEQKERSQSISPNACIRKVLNIEELVGENVPEPRTGHCTVVVGSDIYMFGGLTREGDATNAFHKYDTIRNEWTEFTSYGHRFPPALTSSALAYDSDADKLYLVGGIVSRRPLVTPVTSVHPPIWSYDIRTNSWDRVPISSDQFPHQYLVSAVVLNGILYIGGGYTGPGRTVTGRMYMYDLNRRTFSSVRLIEFDDACRAMRVIDGGNLAISTRRDLIHLNPITQNIITVYSIVDHVDKIRTFVIYQSQTWILLDSGRILCGTTTFTRVQPSILISLFSSMNIIGPMVYVIGGRNAANDDQRRHLRMDAFSVDDSKTSQLSSDMNNLLLSNTGDIFVNNGMNSTMVYKWIIDARIPQLKQYIHNDELELKMDPEDVEDLISFIYTDFPKIETDFHIFPFEFIQAFDQPANVDLVTTDGKIIGARLEILSHRCDYFKYQPNFAPQGFSYEVPATKKTMKFILDYIYGARLPIRLPLRRKLIGQCRECIDRGLAQFFGFHSNELQMYCLETLFIFGIEM